MEKNDVFMAVTEQVSNDNILYNLALRGYHLSGSPEIGEPMSVEELIVDILKGTEQPRFVDGLIIILAKNNINYDSLIKLAKEHDLSNAVGWILEETKISLNRNKVKYSTQLNDAIDKLYKEYQRKEKNKRDTRLITFFAEEFFDEQTRKRRGAITSKWNVLYFFDNDTVDKQLWTYGVIKEWSR